MSGETQWNKKIDFTPKKETIAEPPIVQEGFEEVDEMVRKLTDMRNQKKGFTKLPFLESIYDSITGSTPEPEPEPSSEDADEGEYADGKTIEGLKNKKKSKFQTTMEYTYNLPYNLSFDIFAYTVVQISTGKQPKFPGKKPIEPEKGASQDEYAKAKANYDKLKPAYEDKKMVALMFSRILTCLIGIFIAYNLYFSYAMTPPPAPGVKSTYQMIIDFIDELDPALSFLKFAATPVVWFLKAMQMSTTVMRAIPYQPLLFLLCLLLSGFFTIYVVGYLNPFAAQKKENENIIFILIVLAAVISAALKICIDFKNPMPVTQVPALLLWLLVFGLSLSFLPVGKMIMAMILLYVGMFSMTKSEENGMNVFQTMEDINEKLTGAKVIYDCGDDGNFTRFFKMIDRLISYIIVDNLYLITLIPILLYNISKSTAISNLYIRGFSNFLFTVLILIISSNNEWAVWLYTKLMRGIYNVKDAYVYAKKKYETKQEGM
jgi:hypothetical protein